MAQPVLIKQPTYGRFSLSDDKTKVLLFGLANINGQDVALEVEARLIKQIATDYL